MMLETIFNYREFINENNIQLLMDFKQFNSEISKVNIRTKTKNSIEFKIKIIMTIMKMEKYLLKNVLMIYLE